MCRFPQQSWELEGRKNQADITSSDIHRGFFFFSWYTAGTHFIPQVTVHSAEQSGAKTDSQAAFDFTSSFHRPRKKKVRRPRLPWVTFTTAAEENTFLSAEVTARGVTYWGSLTRSKKPLRHIMSEYEPLKKIKLLSQWRNVSRTRPPVPWPDTLVVGHSFTSAKNALLH